MRYLISICICLLLVAPCMAETITVDANGSADFNNIQAAINAAFDGDTVLVADGTYTGPGNRDIDFLGKAITVRSENGPDNCIIDCNGTESDPHRGFIFTNNEDANSILDGFTITNGHVPGYYMMVGNGGGILCEGASPTISNCTIYSNTSEFNGGGIFCRDGSSPTIVNCTVSNNSALRGGGGILFSGGCGTVDNCIIAGNFATGTYGWGGGISLSDSGATISNCWIAGNSAGNKSAAGIGNENSSWATFINCIITDNDGGGISCRYSSPTITNCTISRNHGGSGITLYNSSPLISNCRISGNRSEWRGGGIYCFSSSPSINNCTIIANRADREGGGICAYAGGSSAILANSIVWDNMAAKGTEIALKYSSASAPPDIMVLYSAVMGGQAAVYVDENCTLNWGQGNIEADPCFVDPGFWADANDTPDDVNDDFWIEGDYHLLPDSPCIDAGDPNYVAEPNETDIDGNPRVINGRIDMGAYESNYIQAAMQFTPQMLNCNSKGKYIKAHLTLPEGFLPEDVDVNAPAVAEPMGAYSEYIKVLGTGTSPVRLEIAFDREVFCDSVTETGEVEITVIGSLTTSRYFYATDTIRIKPRR